jgi:DNA-directed RNA polymerase subunit RPC12/RpoP
MYDVLFKCAHCGSHLSAEDNDVGVAMPCPACEKGIIIPTGDVLFACEGCGKDMLAAKDCSGEQFHCSYCDLVVIVPEEGKIIHIPERRPPAHAVSPTEKCQNESSVESVQADSGPRHTTAKQRQDENFMVTWGDFLATAGLTEPEKEKKKK